MVFDHRGADLRVPFPWISRYTIYRLLKKHGLTMAAPRLVESQTIMTVEGVERWFDAYAQIVKKHHLGPEQIWNMDETHHSSAFEVQTCIDVSWGPKTHRGDLQSGRAEDHVLMRRNRSLQALHLAESAALSKCLVAKAWTRTGLWPVDCDSVLNSSMVKKEPMSLESGKRGRKMTPFDVIVSGTWLVGDDNENRENEPPSNEQNSPSNKKRRN
eukprot:gene10135-11217_t